jgi:hypothetical protein
LGQVRLRGTITEVGAERYESVIPFGAKAGVRFGYGLLTLILRAIGLLLLLRFKALRLLLIPSVFGLGNGANEPDRVPVPVTPFLLTTDDGRLFDCIVRGEVRGGFLKLGEQVEVSGRLDRSKVVRASAVQSVRTGSITRGYVDPRAQLVTRRTIVIIVVIAMFMLFSSVTGNFRG